MSGFIEGARSAWRAIARRPLAAFPSLPNDNKGPYALTSTTSLVPDGHANRLSVHTPKQLRPGLRHPSKIPKIVFGLLLPLPFYALAIYVGRLDGDRLDDDQWKVLYEVMKLTVSIFPVVFTMVAGMTLQALATYKLENGVKLGTLERLMGSLSLGSTIMTNFKLGPLDLLTIPILFFWALSPLGGQAAVNIVGVGFKPVSQDFTVPYFSTEGNIGFASADLGFQSSLNAIYAASIFAPTTIREAPMDLWGNVKIPYLSSVSKHGRPSPDGWYDVKTENLTYSALIGIPALANLTHDGNTTFSIISSYLELECDPMQTGNDHVHVETAVTTNLKNGTFYTYTNDNNTFLIAINGANNVTFGSYVQPSFLSNMTLTQPAPWKILFWGGYGAESRLGYTQCTLTTVYVETSVFCDGISCSAIRIRPSPYPHAHPWNTDLACPGTFTTFASNFLPALGSYPFTVHDGYSGPAEQYLQTGSVSETYYTFNGKHISTEDFSARFGQLLNTYWHASFAPSAMTGDFASLWDGVFANPAPSSPAPTRHSPGRHVGWVKVYQISRPWMALFVIATSIMLLAAMANGVLLWLLRGPQVLGYVSSLLRESRHVTLPPALRDSTADGDELTVRGKDLRVCLGDVEPEEETGYIGIKLCEQQDSSLGRLAKRRFYR